MHMFCIASVYIDTSFVLLYVVVLTQRLAALTQTLQKSVEFDEDMQVDDFSHLQVCLTVYSASFNTKNLS